MKKTFPRLFKLALSYKGWMLFAALLGFLTVGSGIGLMMTSAYIIAKAALHPSIAELQIGIVGVRFFGISRGVFRYLERYISHEVTFRLLQQFRAWFYRAVEPLAPARLLRYRSGDLLTRVVADVESLENLYVRIIAPPLVAALVLGLMWLIFGIFDPLFSLLLAIFFLAAGVGVPFLTQRLSRTPGEELITLRAELNTLALDGIQGMAELLAFGQAEAHFRQFDALNARLVRMQRRMALIAGLHEALIGLLMNLAVLAILLAAIPQVSAGILDGVYLAVLVIGAMAAFEAALPLPAAAQHLDSSLKAAERLFEITDVEPVFTEPAAPVSVPKNYSITAEALSFYYPDGKRWTAPHDSPALKNLNFEAPEGSKIAIVGPSGAGKTTLLNLLLRFWEYEQGSLRLGGRDIREFATEELRRHFAVVSQNTHLFNGTVRENLLLGNPAAGEPELFEAAKQAQIHKFIQNLPEGYDTWIGEQGLQLSGGERQRLAIARALLKNAPLLILDEPTANLDAITERSLLQTIWQLANRKTLLIITHRLVGLENVDEILVLVGGGIVERGTQAELLAREGIYRQMWKLQRELSAVEGAGRFAAARGREEG